MRSQLSEILELQLQWSSANTPAMERRGIVVRKELPAELARFSGNLEHALGPRVADLSFEGRDGTGRKTAIPWARFYSASRSPSAQNGWYCVYLFRFDGSGVYLALAHGSTSFLNGMFVPRDDQQLAELLAWARGTLGSELFQDERVQRTISLGDGPSKLARPYEKSTVAGIWYPADDLPDDARLVKDAEMFAELLGKLYRAQDDRRTPGETAPEVVEALEAVEGIAKPLKARKNSGQGRGLTGQERQAVERRAMEVVRAVLESEGFAVEDHSSAASYDFMATKDGCETVIEVKGTTGGLGTIMLTANEVALHQSTAVDNALFVVHSIDLDRQSNPPKASGGLIHRLQPWRLDPDLLKPMAFEYALHD